MARLPRSDGADTWHHVMNRGVARRTVFEGVRDVRYFLSRLARAVRTGRIEVHAYCLMTTHFHLLVRSPKGEMGKAMRVVQNDYVRWFNRGRCRDGALFRGRYRSSQIDTLSYRELLVRYIDFNPVLAGLVETPSLYPHGSARWYLQSRRPPWLERNWIESAVCLSAQVSRYEPRLYPECFGEAVSADLLRVVDRRIAIRARGADPLDELVRAPHARVIEWMRRKALLADGTAIGLPVCDPKRVGEIVDAAQSAHGDWAVSTSQKPVDAWQLMRVALLRELCASAWAEIGIRVGLTDRGASQSYVRHSRVLTENAEYATVVAELGRAALDSCLRAPVSQGHSLAATEGWAGSALKSSARSSARK